MSSTRAVEVSIHAMSPLLGVGGASAARANVGPSAARATPASNGNFLSDFGTVRMLSPGRFFGLFGRRIECFAQQMPAARAAAISVSFVQRALRVQIPCHRK